MLAFRKHRVKRLTRQKSRLQSSIGETLSHLGYISEDNFLLSCNHAGIFVSGMMQLEPMTQSVTPDSPENAQQAGITIFSMRREQTSAISLTRPSSNSRILALPSSLYPLKLRSMRFFLMQPLTISQFP